MKFAAAALLLWLAAAPAVAQKVPRLPSQLPGANRINSLPKTPKAAANRAQDEQVQELMREALATDDPEEQAEIYTKILLIDPTNQVAYNGRRDALERMESEQLESEAAALAEQQAIEESLNRERNLRSAVSNAERAYMADDLERAEEQILIAEEIAPDAPEVVDLGFRIRERLDAQRRMRWILWSIASLVLVGLVVWLVVRVRRKDPYLEITHGPDRGRRMAFDGDVFSIGAVPEDDQGKNDLVISDPGRMISRFHCEIHRRNNRYYLIDLGSTNGTFLNNKQLQPGRKTPLKRNAHFRMGDQCVVRLGFERRR